MCVSMNVSILCYQIDIFQQFGLCINWVPEKTECMLAYRGKGATKALQARRTQSGKIAIRIPDAPRNSSLGMLHVVNVFKHLGGHITVDGGVGPELSYRSSSAMHACAPLAGRVFGSHKIGVNAKHDFADSLIISRLCFNSHTWTIKDKGLAKLNSTYMRVYRRIHGHCRYKANDNIADLAVRRIGGIPSIDCLLRRARLRFLARISRSDHQPLKAILSLTFKGKHLPWVQLVNQDMVAFYQASKDVQDMLPCPGIQLHDDKWHQLMYDNPHAWNKIVDAYFFSESCLDRVQLGTEIGSMTAGNCEAWPCPDCTSQFPNEKALMQHRRKVHQYRDPRSLRIDGSGICPACQTNYRTRMRTLAHVCDRRNVRCGPWILHNVPVLSPEELSRLGDIDRAARNAARKAGHSHAIAVGPAVKRNGRHIGYVRS